MIVPNLVAACNKYVEVVANRRKLSLFQRLCHAVLKQLIAEVGISLCLDFVVAAV